jgi:ribosomal protein L29
MSVKNIASDLAEIAALKKDLFNLRVKKSSGDQVNRNEYSKKRKEIARKLTKINSIKKQQKTN